MGILLCRGDPGWHKLLPGLQEMWVGAEGWA